MKHFILILAILFSQFGFCSSINLYRSQPYPWNNHRNYNIPYTPRIINNYYNLPILNNNFYNPYKNRNPQTKKRIRGIHVRKYLNDNYLSFNFQNPFSKGSLTGYSIPINQDVYSQFGIPKYNPKTNLKTNSSCRTDLFTSPNGNEMNYSNGRFYKDIQGSQGKTGATIIYD